MPHPNRLVGIVMELRVVRAKLVNQLKDVNAALAVLAKSDGGEISTKPKRRWSALSRKRFSLARNARWEKTKGAWQPTTGLTLVKRTIPVAGKKRIDAAARHAS